MTATEKKLKLAPGMVVIAAVRNTKQNPDHAKGPGLYRPAIVIEQRSDGPWALMGFTKHSAFQNGDPRKPLKDWETIPLRALGYLWGPRLPIVPERDIREQIGWVSLDDAEMIADYLDDQDVGDAFVNAVCDHYGVD